MQKIIWGEQGQVEAKLESSDVAAFLKAKLLRAPFQATERIMKLGCGSDIGEYKTH